MRDWTPRPFRPAPWAHDPHVQTVAGRLLRPRRAAPLSRERWATPDGDFLDVDLTPDPAPDAPLVLLLHGLEGDARRGYAHLTYRLLAERGIRGVGLNFRGCSGTPNRSARAYHSGATDDVGLVVDRLRARFPGRALGGVGFSLGGNALLKYLGELGESGGETITAAAAVSVPYDLEAGARVLEETRGGRFYSRHFLRSLVAKVAAKREILRDVVDVAAVRECRTIRAFDDAVTAPIHGFRDAADYYRRCSSSGFLHGIRVPTLLVHAMDDPFLPPASVPVEAARENSWLVPAFTRRGGHVGFMEGPPWAPRFWAEEAAVRFLHAALTRGGNPADSLTKSG